MSITEEYLQKIWGTKWKYLIILDACRYDYFEKVYRDYLEEGVLERVFSPASGTLQWLTLTFRGYYRDIVYVSANPYVNSKMEVEDWHGTTKFDARKHFYLSLIHI